MYLSFGTEVSTQAIVNALKSAGKTVCAPLTENGDMRSVLLKEPLKRNAFGILQPEAGAELTCAVALTPLLAADGEGYRLGYGGGYYDRYFASHPDVIRIGLMYGGQAAERLPREDCDVPLDAVVTERDIRYYGRK